MKTKKEKSLASWFLRVGIAIAFLYAGINSLINADAWIGFIPLFLRDLFSPMFFLVAWSIYEIVLSIWLISGKYTYEAGIFASITLFLILFFNLQALELIFRDISIFFSAIALSLLEWKNKNGNV